ncbi:unnamed protein product [Cylindrotheca closterium]|uniref:HSF-type DNA-binding domain-containing protein n=1 Tax=Cylindrotheca closterium TaxID=2856 RepID=A0AAD2JMF6_9STRA|nr:unnamed protein product [Cylindrotheca closterium]
MRQQDQIRITQLQSQLELQSQPQPRAQAQPRAQPPLPLPNGAGSIKVVSGSGFRYLVPFPYKLHQMLEETEAKDPMASNIVSWLPDGLHFKVHDSVAFMEKIVPQFFKQKSYKSFQRQLHIYGFKRILKGPLQGAFHHPKFIKGNRQLTHDIDRIKAPVARKNAKPAITSKSSSRKEMGQSSEEPWSSVPKAATGPMGHRTTSSSTSTTTASSTTSSPDTLEWLVTNTGFQFSDLEPSKIAQPEEPTTTLPTPVFSQALLSQADQILTLFADSPPQDAPSSLSSFLMMMKEQDESLSRTTTSKSDLNMQQQQQQQQLFAPSLLTKQFMSSSQQDSAFYPKPLPPQSWTCTTSLSRASNKFEPPQVYDHVHEPPSSSNSSICSIPTGIEEATFPSLHFESV